jgi:hypothetical protein
MHVLAGLDFALKLAWFFKPSQIWYCRITLVITVEPNRRRVSQIPSRIPASPNPTSARMDLKC